MRLGGRTLNRHHQCHRMPGRVLPLDVILSDSTTEKRFEAVTRRTFPLYTLERWGWALVYWKGVSRSAVGEYGCATV